MSDIFSKWFSEGEVCLPRLLAENREVAVGNHVLVLLRATGEDVYTNIVKGKVLAVSGDGFKIAGIDRVVPRYEIILCTSEFDVKVLDTIVQTVKEVNSCTWDNLTSMAKESVHCCSNQNAFDPNMVWSHAKSYNYTYLLPTVIMERSIKDGTYKVIPCDSHDLSDWQYYSFDVASTDTYPFSPNLTSVPVKVVDTFLQAFNSNSLPWRLKLDIITSFAHAMLKSKENCHTSIKKVTRSWSGTIFLLLFVVLVGFLSLQSEQFAAQEQADNIQVNYYETLGVPRDASFSVIKRAYRELMKKWHPDNNPNCGAKCADTLNTVVKAYQTLSYPVTKQYHDLYGVEPPAALFKKEKARHGHQNRQR